MSLTKLKAIDDKTKSKIYGYSRKMQKQLSISIPIMLQNIIMLYYWIQEKFTDHGDATKLDGTYLIAIGPKGFGPYNTVYGNNVININDTSIKSYEQRLLR